MGILECVLLAAIGFAVLIYVLRTEDKPAPSEESAPAPSGSNAEEPTEQS